MPTWVGKNWKSYLQILKIKPTPEFVNLHNCKFHLKKENVEKSIMVSLCHMILLA